MTDDDDMQPVHVAYFEDGHSGPGWYVWAVEYPEEGAVFYTERPTAEQLRDDMQSVEESNEGKEPTT